MESGEIRITQRELHRYHVLKMVIDGRLTLNEAAELLGVSYRQVKRLKRDAAEGISGLVHGNRDKELWNKTPDDVRNRVVALSEYLYPRCGNLTDNICSLCGKIMPIFLCWCIRLE